MNLCFTFGIHDACAVADESVCSGECVARIYCTSSFAGDTASSVVVVMI